jgi:hypothetical protein
VRKEKVMAALDWLKLHNPLFKDVEINRHVFDGQPDEFHCATYPALI